MLKKCIILLFVLLLFLFLLFNNRNFPVSGDSFLGSDVRRFQNTKAWELAKAIEDKNIPEIKHQVVDLKVPVDTRDRKNDFTPLMYAVFNNNIQAVRMLLNLGADPNIPNDSVSGFGENSVILACRYSDISAEILKLLLKYGGNPNSTECGRSYDIEGDWTPARCSALSYAISSFETIEKIKFLVEAGADVNLYNGEYQNAPLMNAIVFDRMDMALYLLEHGADANCKFERLDKDGNPYYVDILGMLRECYFRLDSQEYKDKLKVIKILKDRGVDYWKTPIREENIDEINNVMHFKTYKELQYYLKRY